MLAFLLAASPGGSQPPSLRQPVGDGPLRSFLLQDSAGRVFTPEQLRGKVWVAHFFFTTCTAGCAQTTATMKSLQERFRDHPNFALVSISVNPENDSVDVLQRYARELNAAPNQWFFLRGAEATVHEVVQAVFFETAKRDPKGKAGREIEHSFHLALVDHRGHLVGRVDGREEQHLSSLEDRIRELLHTVLYEQLAAEDPARIWFPRINAGLNGLCAILLLAGYLAIKQRKETLHSACMVAALAVSAVFLACYLYYHFGILDGRPTRFWGEGWVRVVYFAILLTHTLLAAAAAPLAITVAILGFRDSRARHVRLARWTFPIWLYVSFTGVVVYWMLYQLYPPF